MVQIWMQVLDFKTKQKKKEKKSKYVLNKMIG